MRVAIGRGVRKERQTPARLVTKAKWPCVIMGNITPCALTV